jgi:hypothetical protein
MRHCPMSPAAIVEALRLEAAARPERSARIGFG